MAGSFVPRGSFLPKHFPQVLRLAVVPAKALYPSVSSCLLIGATWWKQCQRWMWMMFPDAPRCLDSWHCSSIQSLWFGRHWSPFVFITSSHLFSSGLFRWSLYLIARTYLIMYTHNILSINPDTVFVCKYWNRIEIHVTVSRNCFRKKM